MNQRIGRRLFILAELAIYAAFLSMDLFFNADSSLIKFTGILLCLIMSLSGIKTAAGRLTVLAIAFTVFSDVFLLLRNDHYSLGIASFCVVQLLYFARLHVRTLANSATASPSGSSMNWASGRSMNQTTGSRAAFPIRLRASLLLRISVLVLLILAGPVYRTIPLLVALTVFYFINLTINVWDSWALCRQASNRPAAGLQPSTLQASGPRAFGADTQPHRQAMQFALGLTLFLCCDLCVGLHNFSLFPAQLQQALPQFLAQFVPTSLPSWLEDFAAVGMWAFYLPSQILIVLSLPQTLSNSPVPSGLRSSKPWRSGSWSSGSWSSVLLAASTFLASLSAAIALPILCRPFYYLQIKTLNLEANTGYSYDVIRQAFDQLMDYLLKGEPFGTGSLAWSAEGKDHFQDCRFLFRLDFAVLVLSLIVLAILFLAKQKGILKIPYLKNHSPYFYSGLGLLGLVLLGGLGAWLSFDTAFTLFHQLFFPREDNWLFDPDTDQIIRILPEAFFQNCALLVGFCLLILGLTMILADLRNRRKRNRSYSSSSSDLRF